MAVNCCDAPVESEIATGKILSEEGEPGKTVAGMLQLNFEPSASEDNTVMVPLPATVPELNIAGGDLELNEPIVEDHPIWGQATSLPEE